jgi:hypothetical protein
VTPTTHCPPPAAHCPLPIAHYLLPTTYYLLPTAYYLLPTTYYLLPTAHVLTCSRPYPRRLFVQLDDVEQGGGGRPSNQERANAWREHGVRARLTVRAGPNLT